MGKICAVAGWRCARLAVAGKALTLPMNAGVVALSHSGNVRLPEPDENVTIRFRASGMLHIVGRNGGRKLKKIWQEQNVPPRRRDTTPLLFYGDTLIAAAGVHH